MAVDDITEQKQMKEQLQSAAHTDKLTGLSNRAQFFDRLEHAVMRSHRLKHYQFAVLYLDSDRFKTVNDCFGHGVGDQLLQEMAQRLRTEVRAGDSLSQSPRGHTAARLGGDEFVVLLDGIECPDDAVIVADRLLDRLTQVYLLGDLEILSTVSIGIVTSSVSAENADGVLRDADAAMYEAKLAGKAQRSVFDVPMRQRLQNRLDLEQDLRKALEGGQLFLMYQPIVSLQTGEIESFEALVRWQHPRRGVVSPAEFVPIAEDTGLIVSIGEWVLREACRQLGAWHKRFPQIRQLAMNVNLSRRQIAEQEDLCDLLHPILRQAGIPPECLHLEITESMVMQDITVAADFLHGLKSLGVRLAIDDFGTGHSSLSCLHNFPIDDLKIDGAFISNLNGRADYASVIHAIITLAHNMGIRVTAEGVETAEQVVALQALECDRAQGYHFAKPLTAAAAEAALSSHRSKVANSPNEAVAPHV